MASRIKLRRDTSTNWTDVNPILANGEMGIEADTRRVKLGDGATKWADLKYAITDQLRVDGKTINSEMGVSIAQQDPETWINKIKAKANWAGINGVAYDSKGNVYLSGWEEYGYDGNGNGSSDSFVIKFDSQGGVVWSKYIMLDGYTYGGGVVVDSEDNVAAITIDDENSFWTVTKLDGDGTVIWQKTYQDGSTVANGVILTVDSSNDLVIGGTRTDQNHDNHVALLAMKISGFDGSIIWENTIGTSDNNVDNPCLSIDGDDNIIVAGWLGVYGEDRVVIAKLNPNGQQQWSKTISNPEEGYNNWSMEVGSLDTDESGNIYFVGSYEVPNLVTDLKGNTYDGRAGHVVKLNSTGDVQWSRLVGPGDCNDMGAQIVYKEGRLYAMFQTEKKLYRNDQESNELYGGYTTQEIVVACYDADNGKVIWSNNFGPDVLWGYAVASDNPQNYQDTSSWSGRYIAVHGDYVTIAGQAGEYSRADDNDTRSYGWVAQLPRDGSLMDLEGWTLIKNKTPGKYAQLKTEDWQLVTGSLNSNINVVGSGDYTPEDTSEHIKIDMVGSGANQWDFKPNGDLALPVDGNLELSRSKQGDFNVVGFFNEDNNDNIWNWFTSVTTDAAGNKYYAGQWNVHNNSTPYANGYMPMVVKVNTAGEVEWKIRLSNNDIWNNYAVHGQANSVAYDPASGNIVIIASDSSEGNSDQMLVVDIDPANGKVIQHKRYRNDNGDDLDASHINIDTDGNRYITGTAYGNNYINFTVTNAQVASGHNDTLMITKSFFDGQEAPSSVKPYNWETNWDGWYSLNEVDRYNAVEGVVQQGSGISVNISATGGNYAVDSITNGGINYRTGHKIKILGTDLGGATPANDLILRVDNNDTNGTAGAIIVLSGTPAGDGSWSNVTNYTNYNVGSGFLIDVQVNSDTGYQTVYHNTGGANYVVNDVVTFPGTSLGGTNPASSIVIKVNDVGLSLGDVTSGEGTGYEVTTRGTNPLTYVRVRFNGTDFTSGGPWTLRHYTNANAFITKLDSSSNKVWTKWIDKTNTDYGVATDYDSNGNIYWITSNYDEYTPGGSNYRYRPTVTKLTSGGLSQWMKSYSWDGYEGYPAGVQVDSEDKVVIGYNKWHNGWAQHDPVIMRLDTDGDVLWTKKFNLDGGEGWGMSIALDDDDNVYYTSNNFDYNRNVEWTVKLDIQDGDEIWQQEIVNEANYDLQPSWTWNITYSGPKIVASTKEYSYAGFTWDIDGNEGCSVAATLPADGSAADTTSGYFSVRETYYNSEGGNDGPVDRTHVVAAWTGLQLITGRDPIKSYNEFSPVFNYPVYTKGDAGIKFADGTVQTSSAAGLPQVYRRTYDKQYKLKLTDAGKHVYIRNDYNTIILPSYSRVPFEVGTVLTIVNNCGDWLRIGMEEATGYYKGTFFMPTIDSSEGSNPNFLCGATCYDNGGGQIITMLKVSQDIRDGSVWMVTCVGGSMDTWRDY